MRIYFGGYLDFFNPQRGHWLELDLRQSAPLQDVLLEHGIPLGDIQLVVLNGSLVEMKEAIVSEQDEVKLFSAVGGG